MAAPKIIIPPPRPGRAVAVRRPSGIESAWSVLSIIGLAFVLIGGLDLVLAWVPLGLGSPEWEFGTIGASLNGLPLPALGIMLVLGAGVALGRPWQVRAASGACIVLVVALLAFAFLYVTVIPVALDDVTNGAVRAGLMKSVVKAVLLLGLYPILFGWAAYRGLRHSFVR